jgi:5-methyltetrahydrofolate--homocysteine methyltransferase
VAAQARRPPPRQQLAGSDPGAWSGIMADLETLRRAIVDGDREASVKAARLALDGGTDPTVVLGAMTVAMDIVGRRFQDGEMFVPEMLISARAMKEALAILEPLLAAAGVRPEHTAVVGTVEGDLHDIGKNLVAMMWKGAGIEVVDLGVNVKASQFVEAARMHGARLIGVSALLTTTMANMGRVVEAVRAAGLEAQVIIGGAPTTPAFAAEIGADGHAVDAGAAVELARALLARS